MVLAALLLLSAAGIGDKTMESLLRELRSDDPAARSNATANLLAAWPRWKDADLAELEKASLDPDPDVSGRALEAHARIRIRRTLGEKLVNGISRIDDAFYKGDDDAKLEALGAAKTLWKAGTLTREDLTGLERLASRAKWTQPQELDRFLSEPDARMTFAVSPNSAIRARGRIKEVELLGTEGRKRSGQVAEYLSDGAPEVRETALRVIGSFQAREQAPKVAALLKDSQAGVRDEALSLLRAWGAKEYARDYLLLLEDPNAGVRRRALQALGSCGPQESGPHIAKFLKDPFAPTRAEAAMALGCLGCREFAGDVLPLLEDSHGMVRRSAAFALGKLGAVEAAFRLKPHLKDLDPTVRLTSAESLGQLGYDFQAEEIADLFRDSESEVGVEAAWVLGFSASGDGVRQIALLLEDRDVDVRHHAVWALGLTKARGCRAEVAALLQDRFAWVRAEAVVALGRIGNKEDAPAIASLLRDPDRKVRVSAALALGELGAGDPEGILAGLTRDPDRLLGLSSALSLARLGKSSPAALRALLREIETDSLAFACLGTAASDVASFVNGREAWTILERPLKLQRSVETWKDLSTALSDAGLTLEVQTDCGIGRLDKSHALTGRDALIWLFGRYRNPVLVLDGKKVRLMDRRDGLIFWQSWLEGK